ncbi:probable RNA methyltransferase CG1239 isoform X2 [Trichogramma pretiosum]|uniref:probable RNA methyltransferase CG1239 isoform X2 n=1 Tax=Trichogramma pretiosum TaxID=7493 RepID=UPI0006C9A903|nr:probable RNA methyltransferase CG1239 isoform X2 [Trichogramma pretiosum]
MIIPESSSDSSEGVVPGSPQHPHNIPGRVDLLLREFGRVGWLFQDKHVLDIGCADGRITCRIAEEFFISTIRGIDLDADNIEHAISNIVRPGARQIYFCREDYIPQNEAELNAEFETEYNTILCLAVTRSLHLRGGDEGLKLCFRKMYKQLKFGGTLILEPNPFSTYDRVRTSQNVPSPGLSSIS